MYGDVEWVGIVHWGGGEEVRFWLQLWVVRSGMRVEGMKAVGGE